MPLNYAIPHRYFEGINFEPQSEAVGLAKELIEAETGRFEPEKIPDSPQTKPA